MDLQPLALVEGAGFKAFCHRRDKKYFGVSSEVSGIGLWNYLELPLLPMLSCPLQLGAQEGEQGPPILNKLAMKYIMRTIVLFRQCASHIAYGYYQAEAITGTSGQQDMCQSALLMIMA